MNASAGILRKWSQQWPTGLLSDALCPWHSYVFSLAQYFKSVTKTRPMTLRNFSSARYVSTNQKWGFLEDSREISENFWAPMVYIEKIQYICSVSFSYLKFGISVSEWTLRILCTQTSYQQVVCSTTALSSRKSKSARFPKHMYDDGMRDRITVEFWTFAG